MKPTAFVLPLLLGLLVFSSCRKDAQHDTQPPPVQVPAVLSINLNDFYMPANKIDSALAVWEVNGTRQQIELDAVENKLTANLETFIEGAGKMTLTLYTKIKFGNHTSSQWVLEKEMAVNHKTSTAFSAPGNFNDMLWSPRALLKDGVGHSAVVALRPDDPYFLVKDVPANFEKIVVYRGYWSTTGGVRLVSGREWECFTGCINANGSIENKEFFTFFPTSIGNKAWNHIEIVVVYELPNGWAYLLDLNHTL
ncbi:MAG: hypothetical protein EOO10_24050 [Chitinophagaceae bacterium]|nr:MAG: hypothetical protein EOO10_24050 [Chitinophagaceae bacterium]